MMPDTHLPERLDARFSELVGRCADFAASTGRKPPRGNGESYMCCCPAHDDNNPSLSLKVEPHAILVHCFAGCTCEAVCDALGFPVPALFEDYTNGANGGPRLVWDRQGKREHAREAREWAKSLQEPVERLPLPPTLNEFSALEYPPIQPILGPWASQQINLLYAPSGAGKTMFGLAVAYAMAEGQGLIGWEFHGKPRKVLYVDGEMAARMMQERLAPLGSERLHIANIPGWWSDQQQETLNLATEAGQATLSLWVEALGVDVIILDNFQSLAWRDGVSLSSDETWTALKRWCTAERARDKCVILIDHANVKGGVFGTKTKLNVCDLVAELEPLNGDESQGFQDLTVGSWIRFRFVKSRGVPESHESVIQRDFQMGKVGTVWNHRSPDKAFKDTLLELRKEGLSYREIADEMQVSYSSVQRAFRRIQLGDSGDSGE